MSAPSDGGGAFPTSEHIYLPEGGTIRGPVTSGGMSVRQYYKAQVLPEIIAHAYTNGFDAILEWRYKAVEQAGMLADIMIEEDMVFVKCAKGAK